MTVSVPDHDTLIGHIKALVVKAAKQEGWPELRERCRDYDISSGILRKISLWEAGDNTSYNFQKLINAYDLAYDTLNGLKVQKR
jgi:hypothetical protein